MSQGAHTIEFRVQANLIVVEVVLDGETKPFIVDTGASNTVIDRGHLAEAYGAGNTTRPSSSMTMA